MYLAGLSLEHEGETCFRIITTDAGKLTAKLHDREPAILREEDLERYLLDKESPFDLIHARKGQAAPWEPICRVAGRVCADRPPSRT